MYYVHILSNRKNGTLYIGMTNDPVRRISEHKSGTIGGFSSRYCLDRLVYFEVSSDLYSAIVREKQLKKWKRSWKIALIEKAYPEWDDLSERLDDFHSG